MSKNKQKCDKPRTPSGNIIENPIKKLRTIFSPEKEYISEETECSGDNSQLKPSVAERGQEIRLNEQRYQHQGKCEIQTTGANLIKTDWRQANKHVADQWLQTNRSRVGGFGK